MTQLTSHVNRFLLSLKGQEDTTWLRFHDNHQSFGRFGILKILVIEIFDSLSLYPELDLNIPTNIEIVLLRFNYISYK